MKVGVRLFPTDYSASVTDVARAAEEFGFESLFVPEHTHIPASRRTPFRQGEPLPKHYAHSLDPFVALSAAAGVTSSLLLGTSVCLVVERDPITLAKEVASLDHLSGGRFLFGVGGGWNLEEMENHGTNPALRWKILRERMLAMKEIWTQDEAAYHGDFVNFDAIWSWPKPVQRPHPPIFMGGQGPRTFARVIEFCDGWIPNQGSPQEIAPRIQELQAKALAAGRNRISVTYFGCPPEPSLLEQYEEAGVDRVVLLLPIEPATKVVSALKSLRDAVAL